MVEFAFLFVGKNLRLQLRLGSCIHGLVHRHAHAFMLRVLVMRRRALCRARRVCGEPNASQESKDGQKPAQRRLFLQKLPIHRPSPSKRFGKHRGAFLLTPFRVAAEPSGWLRGHLTYELRCSTHIFATWPFESLPGVRFGIWRERPTAREHTLIPVPLRLQLARLPLARSSEWRAKFAYDGGNVH